MGLNYTIRTYVREENLSKCLNWIKDNTDSERDSFSISINKKNYNLYGNAVHFYDSQHQYLDESNFLNKEGIYQGFEDIYFSTSIVFDIDPKIISSIGDWTLEFNGSSLEEFIENFQHHYLGNGRISIGNFHLSISKVKDRPVYEIDFTAVTNSMSIMLESSPSVRKWIKGLSEASESILTYIDLENSGRLILYYKGIDLEILLKGHVNDSSSESLLGFFAEYYNLEFNHEFRTSLDKTIKSRIYIIEDTNYKMYIENNQWIVYIDYGYKFKLNDNEVNKFRQEGKYYLDSLVRDNILKNNVLDKVRK